MQSNTLYSTVCNSYMLITYLADILSLFIKLMKTGSMMFDIKTGNIILWMTNNLQHVHLIKTITNKAD